MAAITLSTMPQAGSIAQIIQRVVATLGDTVDAFVVYRMQRAVPEDELRRAEREINRYSRMMRASRPDASH